MEIKLLREIKNLLNPKKSLKALMTLWFLLFSLVPLAFLTGYSLVSFERVYTDELLKRLNDNFLVVTKTFEDLNGYIKSSIELHSTDDELIFNLSTRNTVSLKKIVPDFMRGTSLSEVNIFDGDGQLIVSYKKSINSDRIENDKKAENGDIFLNDALMTGLSNRERLVLSDINPVSGFDIIAYSMVMGRRGNIAGYLQEIIHVDEEFIESLKSKFNLDLIILDKDFKSITATVNEFKSLNSNVFKKSSGARVKFLDLKTKDQSYAVLVKPYNDQGTIQIGLASSKNEIEKTLAGIRKAVFNVVGVVIVLIVIVLWFVSRRVLRPLNYLFEAVKKLEGGENVSYIPSEGETELSVLTKSFNEMSRKITKTQGELTQKIRELEKTNKELQEAQAQLVHSAKMGSLGQVVAGVAHELNNPIGFIYSNMSILKDYADRITKVLDVVESDPSNIHEAKKEADLEYVMEDLPRLVKSCEDGAKRVRDIVVNLRTFSRTDELEKKEYNITEGIESTLQILKSEYRDRIKIIKNYSEIPPIHCYAGQINQVFMNIISNAIQSVPDKGEIEISVQKKGLEIEVKIKDTGVGIPSDIREKIFDPFFTTKPVGKGTGLGLSISYGIIQNHNGRIEVESEPNKGTTFKIYLPLVVSVRP